MSGASIWEQFSHDPRQPEHGRLRASDRDRDVISDVLGTAYAEGRLTPAELDERSDAVAQARTLSELPAIIDDLVAPSPAIAPPGHAVGLPSGTGRTPLPPTAARHPDHLSGPHLDLLGRLAVTPARWRAHISLADLPDARDVGAAGCRRGQPQGDHRGLGGKAGAPRPAGNAALPVTERSPSPGTAIGHTAPAPWGAPGRVSP